MSTVENTPTAVVFLCLRKLGLSPLSAKKMLIREADNRGGARDF